MGEYETLDGALMALADPTRRAILAKLAIGEARVTDLAAPFPMSLNSISKHIRMLERAELVRRRKRGREHFLTLNPGALEAIAAWIAEQHTLWTRRLERLDQILQEETP